jgi:lysozyme family protein
MLELPNGSESATGEAIVNLAAEHIGQPYQPGVLAPKDDAGWAGPWDSAEFCSWLVYQTTGQLHGCAAGKSAATADAHTGYWRNDALAKGRIVTVDEARRTAGAFILRVPTTIGHIVVSDGTGGTIEAMGAAFGVRRGSVSGRAWDFGILVPGIAYDGVAARDGQSEQPAPSETTLVLRRDRARHPHGHVEALRRALAAAGFDPGPIDGEFGLTTEIAILDFQAAKGLPVDGEVGPETGRALKLKFWRPGESSPGFARPAQPMTIPPPAADWPSETRAVNPSIVFHDIESEYLSLWNSMAVRPERAKEVASLAATIAGARTRYEAVAGGFANHLPWFVVGVLHAMECNCSFKQHLHNGDPLSTRTVRHPKNQPPAWDPSWPWERSAEDAVRVDGLDKVRGWSLARILFTFEHFNGLGPRRKFGRAAAYLWSYSNHYVRGKYVGEGLWDPEATSKQAGAAVLLKQLVASGAVSGLT